MIPSHVDVFVASEGEYARELDLPPKKVRGWVHEVEVPMRKGDVLHHASEYEGPEGRVEFNVHSHRGKETTYHVKGSGPMEAGAFAAPWEGKFYLMWENVSDVAIHLRITARRHETYTESDGGPADHAHG